MPKGFQGLARDRSGAAGRRVELEQDPKRHPGDEMGAAGQKASRKPRADSRRNHERLLSAARAVFSAGGAGASLEAVAREAGVGIGTLYRHFPTREALYQAVYAREVDELVALAETAAGHEDAVAALRDWLRAAVRMIATKKGMVAALAPTVDPGAPFYTDTAARMRGAAAALLARGVEAGRLRADVTADELLRVLVGLCYGQDLPDWQRTATRLLDIFVDGLRRPA